VWPVVGQEAVGHDVVGQDVVGHDVVGHDVVGQDVVGQAVVGHAVVGQPAIESVSAPLSLVVFSVPQPPRARAPPIATSSRRVNRFFCMGVSLR